MDGDPGEPLAEEGTEMGQITCDQRLATGGDGGHQDGLVLLGQRQSRDQTRAT
jgi:hypothetical protein